MNSSSLPLAFLPLNPDCQICVYLSLLQSIELAAISRLSVFYLSLSRRFTSVSSVFGDRSQHGCRKPLERKLSGRPPHADEHAEETIRHLGSGRFGRIPFGAPRVAALQCTLCSAKKWSGDTLSRRLVAQCQRCVLFTRTYPRPLGPVTTHLTAPES